jgi:hypothetical protein
LGTHFGVFLLRLEGGMQVDIPPFFSILYLKYLMLEIFSVVSFFGWATLGFEIRASR